MSRHRPKHQPPHPGGNGSPHNGQERFMHALSKPQIAVYISSPYTERAARAAITVDKSYNNMWRRYGRKMMDSGRFRKFTNRIEEAVLEFERAVNNAVNEVNHHSRSMAAPAPQAGKPAAAVKKPQMPPRDKTHAGPAPKTGGNGHDKPAPSAPSAAAAPGGDGAAAPAARDATGDVLVNLQRATAKLSADQTGKSKIGARGARSSSAKTATPSP